MEQDRTPQDFWDEAQKTVTRYECGVCGNRLGIIWHEGRWQARCPYDKTHEGHKPIQSITQRYRQGEGVPLQIANVIERRSPLVPGQELRAVALAQHRWPDLDEGSAALFLSQAMEVGLNPFFGEAAPLVFRSKRREGVKTVIFFPTKDGRAVLAAREESERWDGPPNIRPITDADEKKKLGWNDGDLVAEARGTTKDSDREIVVHRRYSEFEHRRDQGRNAPAALDPQNQANVRAERWWYKTAFPLAESKARSAQAVTLQEEGYSTEELDQVIEGTYRFVDEDKPRPGARPQRPPSQEATPTEPSPDAELLKPASPELKAQVLQAAQAAGLAGTLLELMPIVKEKAGDWDKITIGQAQALLKEWKQRRS
ncbi:MAG: hypothetical protein ABIH46_11510 [Chloroflexota bacterium]